MLFSGAIGIVDNEAFKAYEVKMERRKRKEFCRRTSVSLIWG